MNTVPNSGTPANGDPQGAVGKALDLLEVLRSRSVPTGVTELARSLDMPKSTVHRALSALARRELVEQDERGRYRLGFGLVALGLGALEQEPLVHASREPLAAEAERLGETVFLVAHRAGALRVLAKAEGNGVLRAAPRLGSCVPVHATAVGKIYLAWAPADCPRPAGPLERFTPRTARSFATLERELPAVRASGFATSEEEWVPGLCVVAAPVQGRGRLLGAVAIAVSAPRLAELGAPALGASAIGVARAIERRLGGEER